MDRRQLLLQEMGITRWQLHRPEVLKGAVGISVAENVRFVVVCDEPLLPAVLLQDVLLSLESDKAACLCVNFEQIQYLEVGQSVRYWLLNENAEVIDRTLPYCLNAEQIYRSPAWAEFQSSPAAKRDFWRQVQQA